MPPAPSLSDELAVARAFAESIAGVLDHERPQQAGWAPGDKPAAPSPELAAALDELGWRTLGEEPGLISCAGLGAVELGVRLAPFDHVDRLLGAAPMAGDLVRSLGAERVALTAECDARRVVRSEPLACAEGLTLHRALELGDAVPVKKWSTAKAAWLAAGVGYLAGLGQGALDLTVGYVSHRRAFASTLAALAPVQQLLADAATSVRGVRLLAAERPDGDALAHAGAAIARACASCQQVTGAIGFTLEYPLHRYTQRARALATFNDAVLDRLDR